MNRALLSSIKMDYGTPDAIYSILDSEFHFTLDPCALPHSAKCAKFYTPSDDGLSRDWGTERVFMNPPYGRAIAKWMAKAVISARGGALVVALVPSRTDTNWWHEFVINVATEIRYIRGRLTFVGCAYPAPFPSAVVVYDPLCSPTPTS